jgi:outer membrane protein assembly factor BamB
VNWPQWRGPSGDGVAAGQNVATSWSETAGLAWKCALPEWGASTPAVWGDAVFVTTHVDDRDLVLLKINRQTGQTEWTRQVGQASTPRAKPDHKSGDDRGQQKFHLTQNLASPSPVTDGEHVVVHFGNGELAAFDLDGNRRWQRNLQTDFGKYSIWWGHANSPVLHAGLVISVCMQDSCRELGSEPFPSYLVAHDVVTGEQRWQTPRMTAALAEHCDAYTTPLFWQQGPRQEMVVMGGQMLDAYDPLLGKQLWSVTQLSGNRVIPSPIAAHGLLFAIQGMREPLVAIRPPAEGTQTAGDAIVWSSDKGTSDSPSPVVWDDLLFMVNNDGILHCFEALGGKLLWRSRLPGSYRASPVAIDGRIYLLNTTGLCTVAAAAREFQRISANQIDDDTLASPVMAAGHILLRGRKALYCVAPAGH